MALEYLKVVSATLQSGIYHLLMLSSRYRHIGSLVILRYCTARAPTESGRFK